VALGWLGRLIEQKHDSEVKAGIVPTSTRGSTPAEAWKGFEKVTERVLAGERQEESGWASEGT